MVSSQVPRTLLRIAVALLTHQLKQKIGPEALEIAATQLVEIGDEIIGAKLGDLIRSRESVTRLIAAGKRADECFRTECNDPALVEAISLSLGDLPSVQKAIAKLPTEMDEEGVLATLKQVLTRDFPNLSPEQVDAGSELYIDCLRQSLLPLEDFTLTLVGNAVLRTDKMIRRLRNEQLAAFEDLRKLISDLQVKEPSKVSLGNLDNVPNLPTHYIVREEGIDFLKEVLLLGDQETAATKYVGSKLGVIGMGGIGKSVLATAFARDEEVQSCFRDGIIWVSLGQTPRLRDRLALVIKALGMGDYRFEDMQRGRALLGELLSDKDCLLILDDVWRLEDVVEFDVLGANCRMLITTRNADLVTRLGAIEYRLGVLNDEQSLTLLAKWIGQKVEELPNIALEVARECGQLPLALAMMGAMVRDGTMWSDLIAALQEAELGFIEQKLPEYQHSGILKSIKLSVDALAELNETWEQRFLELAVFPENKTIPEAAIMVLWEHTGGLSEREARRVLTTLERRALVQVQGEAPERQVSLHDLHYGYVHVQIENIENLHRVILDAYQHRCPQGDWARGPNDGYYYEHLVYHLYEAKQYKVLYSLVDQSWLEAQFRRSYSHYSFANDLEFVINASMSETPVNWTQLVRGCLAYATLGSLATNIPPVALGMLALVGQIERAISYAALIQEPIRKSESYWLLGTFLRESGDSNGARRLLEQALGAAAAVRDENDKAEAIGSIAHAYSQIGDITGVRQTQTLAREVTSPFSKVIALCEIVGALVSLKELDQASKLASEALATVELIEGDEKIAIALNYVGNALSITEDVPGLDRAFEIACSLEDGDPYAYAVANIITHLSLADDLYRALWLVAAHGREDYKEDIFKRASKTFAQKELFDQALVTAKAIWDKDTKASLLSYILLAMVGQGDHSKTQELLAQVVTACDEMLDQAAEKTIALSEVSMVLAYNGEIDQAVEFAWRALDAHEASFWSSVYALTNSAQVLALAGELEKAIEIVGTIEDEERQNSSLAEVSSFLAKVGKPREGLGLIEQIADQQVQDEARYEVVKSLVRLGEIDWALQQVETIADDEYRILAVTAVIETLLDGDNESRAKVTANQVFDDLSTVDIGFEAFEVDFLEVLAYHMIRVGESDLALEVMNRALEIAEQLGLKDARASTTVHFSHILSWLGRKQQAADLAEQAYSIVKAIEDESDRSTKLRELAHAFAHADDMEKALEILGEQNGDLGDGLGSLARFMAREGIENGLETMLSLATSLEDEFDKLSALTAVGKSFAQLDEREKATEIAEQVDSILSSLQNAPAELLSEVAHFLALLGYGERAYEIACQALEETDLAEDGWDKAFKLASVAEAFSDLGHKEKSIELARNALEATTDVWLRMLPFGLRRITLTMVQVGDKEGLEVALRIVELIGDDLAKLDPDDPDRARNFILHPIATGFAHLGEFDTASAVVDRITDHEYRLVVLAQVANELSEAGHLERASDLLMDVLREARFYGRETLFNVMGFAVSILSSTSEDQMLLGAIYRVVSEVDGWWGN